MTDENAPVIGAGHQPDEPMMEEDLSVLSPLQMNPEEYRDIWKDVELSDEQYHELLGVIWEIAHSFVRMGWNLDISQVLFASAIQNASTDSDKLLGVEYAKVTNANPNGSEDQAEKVSEDE